MKTKTKLKSTCISFLIFVLANTSVMAMGSKKPVPAPTPTPAPNPPRAEEPTPIPPVRGSIGSELPEDHYKEIADQVGFNIDQTVGKSELLKLRSLVNDDQVDECNLDQFQSENFSESISFYTQELLDDTPSKVGVIASYYGLSSNEESYYPSSLIRHPLCSVSRSTLTTTLGKNIPSDGVIIRINQFVSKLNNLREKTIAGDEQSKIDLHKEWSTWFSCLGYVESLSTADSQKSESVAKKYAGDNYRKPAGVKFYEDPYQNEASKLNIGLFQFTPNSSGNVQSCMRAWNALYPQCALNLKSNRDQMIKALGSSMQSFNAFCGVHKLIQTFSVQINTNKASATHPQNLQNGNLKNPANRCVSPHFAAGKAYNHFGPFQNSTGNNLNELLSCLERSR